MCLYQGSQTAYAINRCSTDHFFFNLRKWIHWGSLIFLFLFMMVWLDTHTCITTMFTELCDHYREVDPRPGSLRPWVWRSSLRPKGTAHRSWAVALSEAPPGVNLCRIQSTETLRSSYPFLPTPTSLPGVLPVWKKWEDMGRRESWS